MGLLVSGCAGRGSTELLEADLRQHQDRIAAYERQVSKLHDELVAARAETDHLRRELLAMGKEGRQEATEPLSKVAGIQFNSMMTGGRDSDGSPGHDVITAVLAPHDKDGDLVKLGGNLEIEVLDLTRPASEQRVGQWKYSPEQARALWHSGFLASGFQVDLPIGSVPKTGEVILHGRLMTTDGRQFDTTCPVTLASADAMAAPRSLPAPRQSRPVSQSSSSPAAASGREVKTVSAEVPAGRSAALVETAGFAVLEETPTVSRPVPPPRDVPPASELPTVRPGASPRPFPTSDVPKEGSTPKPFPINAKAAKADVVQSSDRWRDEEIPYLR
ncbi:MAG TPA: hypothetical protein VM510_12270 [Caulifigura sp.]|jgi:hypothetical protein|nr:hypothetical protein [Caulifigura sp.]